MLSQKWWKLNIFATLSVLWDSKRDTLIKYTVISSAEQVLLINEFFIKLIWNIIEKKDQRIILLKNKHLAKSRANSNKKTVTNEC